VRLLDINVDLGPVATPAELEALLRGIRVAVDVAHDAEIRRIRRTVTEQMKYPTDSELSAAVERLGRGDEQSPQYKAQMQLEARDRLRSELRGGPPEWWFEYFYLRRGKLRDTQDFALQAAGYERALQASPAPFFATAVGLDVTDPVLYQALVADSMARLAPTPVRVRELRYENPFFKRLFGKGPTETTISTTAQVIETVSTIGSTRRMAQADAAVAERTVDHRVEDASLDLELKRLKVQREREALTRDRIENARAVERLDADRVQRSLIESATRDGLLDVADAIEALEGPDAVALGALGLRQLELEEHTEPDDPDDLQAESLHD
jgi:hypothetical protein